MRTLITTIFTFLICMTNQAQISGNQVYANHNNYQTNSRPNQSIRATDSTLTISTKILLNKKPDFYLVSLGVQQEAENIQSGLKLINDRISKFTNKLATIGVKKDDYYIDFISQAKVYDYKVTGNTAEQIQNGFEIKKNVIIKLEDLSGFDALVMMAAEQNIYNIIKVDYRNYNMDAIYKELLKEATKVVEGKKNQYTKSVAKGSWKNPRIVTDSYFSLYPKTQYKRYQAYETSHVDSYTKYSNKRFIKKEKRKSTTFYYDGMGLTGIDKVINVDSPQIGIQYILELTMVYEK